MAFYKVQLNEVSMSGFETAEVAKSINAATEELITVAMEKADSPLKAAYLLKRASDLIIEAGQYQENSELDS